MRLEEPSIRSKIRVAILQGATRAEVIERFDLSPAEIEKHTPLIEQTTMDRNFRLRARFQRTRAEEAGRRAAAEQRK